MIFVTSKDVIRFRDELSKNLSASTVNTGIKILRVLFQQAWKDGLVEDNQAAKVDTLKIRENDSCRRPFTLDEVKQVLAVSTPEWRGMILAGLYTGQRLGDIARLQWQQVDLKRQELNIVTGKTGRRVIIPIAAPLLKHLKSIASKAKPTDALFPGAASTTAADKATRRLSAIALRKIDPPLLR